MTITIEQTLAVLDEIVAERGDDFVYRTPGNTCHYAPQEGNYPNPDYHYNVNADPEVPYSTPSCIVGEFFHRVAPEVYDILVDVEVTRGISYQISQFFGSLSRQSLNLPYLDVDTEPGVSEILSHAQVSQDGAQTYATVRFDYHLFANSIN